MQVGGTDKPKESKTTASFVKPFVSRTPRPAVLRFTPYAWAKLNYMRDIGDTEVGGFGISSSDDLMLIEDFVLVKQETTSVSIKFDDESVADFFDDQVDAGLKPSEFARVWIHTHPGSGATPSGVDEETFQRVFGGADFSVMFILAQSGTTFARIQFNAGPGGFQTIEDEVDYLCEFDGSDFEAWKTEYTENVMAKTYVYQGPHYATYQGKGQFKQDKRMGVQSVFGGSPHERWRKDIDSGWADYDGYSDEELDRLVNEAFDPNDPAHTRTRAIGVDGDADDDDCYFSNPAESVFDTTTLTDFMEMSDAEQAHVLNELGYDTDVVMSDPLVPEKEEVEIYEVGV